MPNDSLKKYYSYLKSNGADVPPTYESFVNTLSNESNARKYHSYLLKNNFDAPESYDAFASTLGIIKKKETTVSPSVQKEKPISSGTQPKVTQKPSGTSVSQKETKPEILFPAQKGKRNDVFTTEDGKTYRLDMSSGRPVWKGYTSSVVKGQGGSKQDYEIYNSAVTDPATVNLLNKKFNKKASTSEAEQIFTGYQGKEENEYRIRNGVWQRKQKGQDNWVDLYSQGSISALNKEFGQKVKYDAARDKFSGSTEDVQLKEKKYLDQNINSINSKLIGQEEEDVVNNLRKKFPGFTFNQAGTFTDEIKVQAPNGEFTTISLDNWTDDDDNVQAQKLRGFIRTNSSKELASATSTLEETEKENEIKSGININMRRAKPGDKEYISGVAENMQPYVQNVSFVSKEEKYKTEAAEKAARKEYAKQTSLVFADVYDRQKQSLKEGSKIDDKEVIAELAALPKSNDAIRRANEYANDVNKSFKSYNSKIEELSRISNDVNQKLQNGEISEEEFNQVYKPQIEAMSNDIKTMGDNLKIDATNLTNIDRSVNESVAKQYIIDEAQGSLVGGLAYKFAKGMTYIPRLISPDMTKEDQEALVRSIVGGGTTQQYMESEKRSDITKTLFSLSESMGALASGAVLGGGPATYGAFYGQSYYEMKDDLDQVKDMSDASKVLMSSIYGAASSVLEKFGIDFAMQKTGVGKNLTNSIMKAVFSNLPKNASKEFIEASIMNNAKMFLRQAGIRTAGAFALEGGTEGLQALTQVGIKEVYDQAKDTDYFNNKSGWEILGDIAYEAYLGALGGGIMGTVSQSKSIIDRGVNVALNKDQLDVLFNTAKIDGIPEALLTNLKSSIITGKISKQEAQDIYNSYGEVKSKIQSIPEEYSIENKSVALDLMLEKDRINKQIAGRDANLVKPQMDRIVEIDNQLKTIGENAVKESTKPVEEGPAEGGGIQYQGTQEGQPEVREGERPVGQAAQPEADLGDRAVEGRGVKEERLITNLDEKINRYETEQAAEGIGTEETVTTDEGKEIKRTKFRAPKNANTKAALAIETGTNPRAAVLKYFISGGKINSTAIQKLFGDKQGRSIKGEVQNRLSFIDNKVGKTPEQIAEYLWMEYGDQFGMTDVDFIPFVEEVISEFKGTTGMVDELLSYENKTQEDYYKQKYGDNFEGYDVSELEDAESVLDYMTDEEIIQMSNEIEAAEAEFAQAPEIVAPEETLEDLKTLDVTDKTNLQKVQSFLDKLDKDIDKFGKETLGVNLPVAVAKAVIKTLKTLVDAGVSLEQALKQAAEIHNVSEVDIVDSFEKIRRKETEASKAAKKISRPTQKKVVVNEATALRDQLRLEARAARESAMDLKRKQRALVAVVNGMKRSGSINTTQATALAKRIVNTNIDNPVMVKRMLDYAGRLFQDAEYKNKLSNARSINKKIKSAIKSKDLQASVVAVAKDFSKIDPRLLEDIDRYIENATKVLDAVKRTRLPEMREAMNFDDINAYTEEANAEMEEYRKEEVKELNDQLLESIDTEGMTATELMDLIRSLSDVDAALPSEKKRAIILDYINKVKDAYTPIVESIVKGTDPFTGDSIDTSKKAKELIGKLIDIDINKLDVREAVKVIDAINNFITNGITDNVESIVRTYEGQVNAQEIADSNMPIREAKLGGIARLWSEQMMNLPVLADWIFKSPKRAIQVLNKMGFTDFQNGVAKAVKNWTNYVDSYHNTFKKKKANGKNFMDAENIYERGMYAFLKRTVAGDEIAQQKEFERKVGLISKSIDVLKKQGSQKDLKVAEMYEQLMDKFELNKDGVTISDVESKVDPINKDAVNWWINTWAENYGDLADVSQNVYNTVLGKDINYTPDKFSSLDVASSKQVEDMIDSMGGGGFAVSLNYEYDKKTGVLMPSSKPVSMETGRYVNLNFDMNNSRALKSALIDINTAGATKQMKGFLKSDSWNDIIKNKEDRDLFRRRVDSYILASRNKRTATDDQALAAFEKTMRVWASIGATRALGGIFQPVKQVVPVMVNTAINVGRNFSLAVTRDQYSWIDKIGMPISNRGMESMAAFEDADKEFENNIAIGAYTKAMSGVEALNKKWLKLVLSNPDVFAARSSFIAYYKQALRAKGMSADIDFTKPEDADQEALNYAQHMVDRQQNVSDAALMGDLFTSNKPYKKIIKNTLFPFMSFVINQKSRMVTDLATFSSKDVSIQEKINAFKSLSALTSEMAVFHTISFAIKYYIVNAIVGAISGEEEDEEEVEKAMKRQFGYTVGTVAKDILSPVPIGTDKAVEYGVDYLLDIIGKSALEDEAKLALKNKNIMLEDEEEDPITGDDAKKWIDKYIEDNRVKVQSYEAQGPGGVYRIAFDKFSEIYDTYKLASEGSYESEGFAGKPITKYIDEQGREDIKEILPYYAAWSALGIPAEFGTIFRKYESKIKRDNGLTEKQKESEKEVLKESNKEKLNDLEFALVKKLRGTTTQSGAERVIEELNWIKENGGVKGDKQIKKYIEILEANGEVMYDDLKKIQSIK